MKALAKHPERNSLQCWLQLSPSHSRIPWGKIPARHPELGLEGEGEKAMRTAFRQLGYVRRASKRKGFSDDSRHKQLRYEFAQEGVRWSREQVYNQIFSDEIWANEGAHTTSYVTVKEDRYERYLESNVQHINTATARPGCSTVRSIRDERGRLSFGKKHRGVLIQSNTINTFYLVFRPWWRRILN